MTIGFPRFFSEEVTLVGDIDIRDGQPGFDLERWQLERKDGSFGQI